MSYQFTAEEIARIQAARALCPEGELVPTSTGNWVPFYTEISSIIGARISAGPLFSF